MGAGNLPTGGLDDHLRSSLSFGIRPGAGRAATAPPSVHPQKGEGTHQINLNVTSSRSLLVTLHAFFRSRPRAVGFLLRHLVMTRAAAMMERLLVGHDRSLRTTFKLDLRNLRQQLWLGIRPRMTIATHIYGRRAWILLNQLRRQGGRAISRPGSFVRRMLDSFSSRLGCVMAFNTGYLRSAISAAVLGDVIEVVKLDRPKFRLSSQRDYFRRFLSALG